MYVSNNRASNIWEKIDRSNEKKDEPTIIVGDFNALLSATDRTSI